jgi:hypothetical protein
MPIPLYGVDPTVEGDGRPNMKCTEEAIKKALIFTRDERSAWQLTEV